MLAIALLTITMHKRQADLSKRVPLHLHLADCIDTVLQCPEAMQVKHDTTAIAIRFPNMPLTHLGDDLLQSV